MRAGVARTIPACASNLEVLIKFVVLSAAHGLSVRHGPSRPAVSWLPQIPRSRLENRDRQRSEDFVSGTSQFSGRERDNFHRSWLVLWHEMRLRRALLKESPPGGGPFSPRLRCSSVEGPDLLHRCALPWGKMPRRAPSPGFPTGSPGIPPNELPAATIGFKYDGLSRLVERKVTRGVSRSGTGAP